MSLEVLADEIASAAAEEAKAILAAAEEEATAIEAAAEDEAAALLAERAAEAEREAALNQRELVAAARQANQKRHLLVRRAELDATLTAVQETVAGAKLKGRKGILDALLKEAKASDLVDPVLRPTAADRKALEGSGLTLGDDVDGIGGFVLEQADGRVTLDFRFDGRLERAWTAALPDVTNILFGDA